MSKEALRLKRHETFSIREGWIEKGINKIKYDPKCFSKDEGSKKLGLGSNMVKSLRYWLSACGLVSFNTQTGAKLTEVGELIQEHDPYLNNINSWWIIHYLLVKNSNNDAPVLNAIFNMSMTKFEKESLTEYLIKYFEEDYELGAISSLESDIAVAIKSYCNEAVSDPENNMNCPFGKLGLMKQIDRNTYCKTSPQFDELNSKIIFLTLTDYLEDIKTLGINNSSFNLEDFMEAKNNPMKLFNLTKSSLFVFLDDLRKIGWISIIKTAGLNTIHIEKNIEIKEVIRSIYLKK